MCKWHAAVQRPRSIALRPSIATAQAPGSRRHPIRADAARSTKHGSQHLHQGEALTRSSLGGPFVFKTAAHRALVLEVALNFLPVQVVISQRRVDFGRGQRRQSLANLLDGQSQFPPTRHPVDRSAVAFNAGLSTEDAGRVDDHGTQLSCRRFRDCIHVQKMLVLGRCVKPTGCTDGMKGVLSI